VLKNYVQWVLRVQSENDPNGIDVRTEPKFNLPNGDVYSGGWCRPQNDGPGLRATALMDYASWLIANNQTAYVKQYLWTGNPSVNKGGAIKYDLDWVVNGWSSNGCDLWEEVQSNDFFWNRITSKYALLTGSGFASNFGDASSATSYKNAGLAINSTLYASHYNGAYIQESSNRQKDAAVVCGLNSGFWSGDNLFAPTSIEVANTIKTLNSLFCSSYAINTADSQNGVPGVLYGRYQGDSYAGGNPWVLLTAALGQLLYRGAHALLESQEMPDASTLEAWHAVFGDAYDPVVHSTPIMLSKLFASAGDGPLYRLRRHVEGNGFHLQEQIDRNTGFQLSAHDLTWSYTEVLVAMQKRTQYIRAAKELFPEQTARDPYFA
jgi:glucoamylase